MAKQFSTFQFVGKVGTLVGMKGKNGSAYIRTLVTPSNPKTAAQTDQRVKMSLAGQMSKLTPQALLVGMSNDKRMRRPNFTGNIARNAVVTTVNNVLTAKIDPALVSFSEGATYPLGFDALTVTAQANSVVVAGRNVFPSETVTAIIAIAAFADANGKVTSIAAGTLISAAPEAEIAAPTGYSRVNVYYVPVVRAEGATNVSYQHAVDMVNADHGYASIAEISQTGAIEYRRSVYINSYEPGA